MFNKMVILTNGGGNSQYKYAYLGNNPSPTKITLGFKPKALLVKCNVISGSNNWSTYDYYDEEVSPTQATHNTDGNSSTVNIGSSGCIIYSIDSDGFTLGFGGVGTDLNIAYYVTYLATN